MTRRLILAIFLVVLFSNTSWSKWKQEEQDYLDTQFKAILDKMQALKAQVDALNARLDKLQQEGEQFQKALVQQERDVQTLEQLISAIRTGNEESLANLKNAVAQLRNEQQKSFDTLSGKVAQSTPTTTEVVTPAPRQVPEVPITPPGVQGYITLVQGETVTIDLGSTQGLRSGSRLSVYKAADPNTRVGEIEVTQVVDAGNSRARIVNMNAGVKPDFSDIVRLE